MEDVFLGLKMLGSISGNKDSSGRPCPFCKDGTVYEDDSPPTSTYSCDTCDHSGYV